MSYVSLEECLLDLEKNGHLVRIKEEVDPYLEMAAIHLRVYEAGGPALLFEKVKGSRFRAASNIFGTIERSKFIFRDSFQLVQQLIKLKGNSSETITKEDLREYVIHGAAKRLRPKLMTVCVSLFGLVPVLWASGVGVDVMQPIVLPMIGGVLTSSTHILLVTPLIFLMSKEYELRKYGKLEVHDVHH